MELLPSDDFGAQRASTVTGGLEVHDHLFPSAPTPAIAAILGLGMPDWVLRDAPRTFNAGVMRLDLFGVREGRHHSTAISTAPLRPEVPTLEPGRSYLRRRPSSGR